MKYRIYNKEILRKEGKEKAYLRTFKNKGDVEVFISNNKDSYVIEECKK